MCYVLESKENLPIYIVAGNSIENKMYIVLCACKISWLQLVYMSTELSDALRAHECVDRANMVLPVRERGPHQGSVVAGGKNYFLL